MTEIRKSDAQLDAEAAAQTPSEQTMIRWQAALAAEPPVHLTGRHPALIVDGDTAAIEATKVGVDFTEAMIEWMDASFPVKPASDRLGARGRNPVHDGLVLWERKCRREHARWADHRGRPACADIAWAVLRDRTSLDWAARLAGVSYPRAERLLLMALRFMRQRQERWMDDEAVVIPAREPREWMSAQHRESHAQGGLHRSECPLCRSKSA